MLSRRTYIERGAMAGGAALAPLILAAASQPFSNESELLVQLLKLAVLAPLLAGMGAAIGIWFHRRSAMRGVSWNGPDETAALLKQSAAELVAGKADEKLWQQSQQQSDQQEGRASALYLLQRIQSLRQTDAFKRANQANPISVSKRLIWSVILVVLAGAYFCWPLGLWLDWPKLAMLIAGGLAAPIFLTALLIVGFGLKGADAWLRKITGLKRLRPEPKVKLRKRDLPSVGGSWHTRERGPQIPVLRLTVIVLVGIGALIYGLRHYGDLLFGGGSSYQVATIDRSENTVSAPPAPTSAPPRSGSSSSRNTQSSGTGSAMESRRTATPPPQRAPTQHWSQVSGGGTLLIADLQAMEYAGWDVARLDAQLTRYKKDRLDSWYDTYRRQEPGAAGKLGFEATLQPQGQLSNIRLLGTEIHDPDFINGLIDRLDAASLGTSALDPVTVILAFDFRP